MFNLIPIQAKLAIFVIAVGAAGGYGFLKGREAGDLALERFKTKAEKTIADLEKKSNQVNTEVVVEYVDRVNTIKEKEYVYLESAKNDVPAKCDMSNGWVHTHDASASSSNVDPTRASDASPSGIADNTALVTIISNYSRCEQNAQQLALLQKWILENKKIVDDQAKEAQKK